MAFRWKTGFDDSLRAQDAAANMDGYRPLSANGMQGYRPNVPAASPYNNEQVAQQNYDQFMGDLQAKRQQLAQLQAQLAEIDRRIAEIDRSNPQLKDSQAWEIAAKRAEAGDMSAYDNLMNRGAGDSSNAGGIDNELYNAEKLLGGLKTKSNEDREIVRGNIEATLRRAEEWSARNGKELPSSYYRLKKAVDDSFEAADADMNAREYGNEIALKLFRGTATKDDIEKGVAWAENNMNSDAAKEIFEAAKSGRYGTIEAKQERKEAEKKAKAKIAELQKLSVREQADALGKMEKKLHDAIMRIADWDNGYGITMKVK